MNELIGDLLPIAVVIAVSPPPIIAVVMMITSSRARSLGWAFVIGWLIGLVGVTALFALLGGLLPESPDDASRPVAGAVLLLLGLILAFLALRTWWSRAVPGIEPEPPGWMAGIDGMPAGRALVLGLLLAGVNPKNLVLAASAGLVLSGSGGAAVVPGVVFVVVASLSVVTPVVAVTFGGDGVEQRLRRLRDSLVVHSAAMMAAVLGVIATVLIGRGIAAF